jgi:hypothetical protein
MDAPNGENSASPLATSWVVGHGYCSPFGLSVCYNTQKCQVGAWPGMKSLYSPGAPRDTCSRLPIGSRIPQEARTMSLPCLPRRVSQCLRVLGPCCHYRHPLVFSWLVVWHLRYGERANLKALARHGPPHLAYQHSRRLRCAVYRCTKTWLWWGADQALQAFLPQRTASSLWWATVRARARGGQNLRWPRRHASASTLPTSLAFGWSSAWPRGRPSASRWSAPSSVAQPSPPTRPTMPCFGTCGKRSGARPGAKRWWSPPMRPTPPEPMWS